MMEIIKTERLESDPEGYGQKVTATYPAWLLKAEGE